MATITFTGRVRLQDEHGLQTSKTVRIDIDDAVHTTGTAQRDAAVAVLTDYVETLDDIIDPVVVETSITMPVIPSGLKSSPGDQGVAEGANLELATLDLLGNVQSRPFWLPGAAASVFLGNFRQINTAVQALQDFISSFSGTAGAEVVISDGEEVTGVNNGTYATRRRNSNA